MSEKEKSLGHFLADQISRNADDNYRLRVENARLTVENARLREALQKLGFAAQTTGGTAGRDDALVAAIDLARAAMEATDDPR